MARQLRIEFPDALYHVTSRGNEQRPIFRSNHDREAFLGFLGEAVVRFGWSLTAWVLMTNHFHLVLQTPEPNLSRGMQWLLGSYVSWFNRRHHRSGHLFAGRFKARLVEKETYLAEVIRYVILNPVRAKMVARPEQYRWSSYAATAGQALAPAWLDIRSIHALFDRERETAEQMYRDFVAAKIDSQECLWDQVQNRMYLGSKQWTRRMRDLVESRPVSTDHPRAERAVGRPSVQTVVKVVGKVCGVACDVIRARAGGPQRRLVAWLAWHEGLVTLRSIAAALRLRSEGYISNLIRRCEQEFGSCAERLAQLDLALAALRA